MGPRWCWVCVGCWDGSLRGYAGAVRCVVATRALARSRLTRANLRNPGREKQTPAATLLMCGGCWVALRSDPTYNARFGFVEFTDIPMAHTACMLNGLMLAERSLRVSMAKTGMSKPVGR